MRSAAVLPLVVVLLAACNDAKDTGDAQAPPPGASADAGAPPADSFDVTAPAAPMPGQPVTPEDSARAAVDDSIREARLFQRRAASMDDYAGCMAKTKDADAAQRPVLEAACRHARGAPR
jgi:hypothetical protein